jgi:hypothetical protein
MACAELTATVTATATTNGKQQRPATAQDTRTIRSNLAYVRPESGRSAAFEVFAGKLPGTAFDRPELAAAWTGWARRHPDRAEVIRYLT